jgi:ketosteroid isomerase-like protein
MALEDENRQVFVGCYEAARTGDWETFKAYLDPDVELHEAASLPYGGACRGPDPVVACLRDMFSAWGGVDFTLVHMLVGRDLGFVLFDVRFTARGGNIVQMPVVELWRIRDGKLTEIRPFYFDTHAAWTALTKIG